MNTDLSGKVALVTGSTGGIGLETAVGLSKLGACVVVNGRTQARVDAALKSLLDKCPNASAKGIAADLGTAAGVEKLIQQLPTLDILVNNMAIYDWKTFYEITDAEWFNYFETNVMSCVRLCRQYLPKMTEKNWGRIVFVSSDSAVNIPIEMMHYAMTKTAQLSVARGLAEMTKGTNVTVNSVLVGPVFTEGVQKVAADVIEKEGKEAAEKFLLKEFMLDQTLLGRFLTEEEVANMIMYLCSPASSGTNGAALRVEGGLMRGII